MESLFIYIAKASGLIGMFYIAYYLLLRKETFFTANRWFLLVGLMTSVILPWIVFTTIVWVEPAPISTEIPTLDWSKNPMTAPVHEESFEINWYLVLSITYIIGTTLFLIRFVLDFYQLNRVLKGKTIDQQADHKFIDIEDNIAPFSYFNTIVYNSSLYSESEMENILEHEKVHSEQYHTVDVLITRLFCILFWFNPFMWLYKKAILQNLEFIADSEASKNIADKKAYQLTLLKITTQDNCVAIANHFYQSLIKKRIIMLNKNQSKKWNFWKYIPVFPALIAFVFLFQIEVVAKEKSQNKQGAKNLATEIESIVNDIDSASTNILKSHQAENNLEINVDGKKISKLEFDKFEQSNIKKNEVVKYKSNPILTTTTTTTTTTTKDNEIPKKEVAKKEAKVETIYKIDVIITKNTTDEEIKEKCEQIKKIYNIDLTFLNIKRNSNGEITYVESEYKVVVATGNHEVAGGGSGSWGGSEQSESPIEPFKFSHEKTSKESRWGYDNLASHN